jgi:hypothetical protein
MGRKRDLVPHVEYGRAFLIKNSLEFLKSGNRLEYCPEGEWVDTVNRQVVPPLPVGWQRKVQACDGTLSSDHLATIERLVRRYTAENVARLDGAIEWKETIERTRRFANAYNALLGELNDWRAGYGLIWRRVEQISGIGGLKPLTHDEVYPIPGCTRRRVQRSFRWRPTGKLGAHCLKGNRGMTLSSGLLPCGGTRDGCQLHPRVDGLNMRSRRLSPSSYGR